MQQVFEEIKIKTEGQGFYNFIENTLDWINKQKNSKRYFKILIFYILALH